MVFRRKVTKQPDGTKVTETRRKVTTRHPNGEFDIYDKKRGTTEHWVFCDEENA